ncbi:ABC-2 transporter permease [Thermovenabulum sp.]|uniref:ABC-2 transporter permease n=1 Tax=Thermovenabulum sp. TaxID=3100335 RepID=UPI003C7E22B0
MFNLIKKDILVQKFTLIYGIVNTLIIILAFQQMGEAMFPACVVALSYAMLQSACAYDDKCNADILLNILPCKRSTVVLARYLSVFAFAVISIFYYAVISSIIRILLLPLKVYSITLEGIVGAMFSLIFINSFYLPVFFKMGYYRSKMLNIFLFFAMFFSIGWIVPMFRNDFRFLDSFNNTYIITALMILAVIIYGISFLVSVKIYERREF